MRTHTETGFEMFGVHQQPGEVVSVVVQSEKYAYAHVVDTCFHSTVHSLGMICVITLRSVGVERLVVLFVVRLLEQDICAYACIV